KKGTHAHGTARTRKSNGKLRLGNCRSTSWCLPGRRRSAVPAWWQRVVPNQCIVQITTDEISRVHFDCRRQAVMPGTESTMANQVFCDISISADGYVAGPGPDRGEAIRRRAGRPAARLDVRHAR